MTATLTPHRAALEAAIVAAADQQAAQEASPDKRIRLVAALRIAAAHPMMRLLADASDAGMSAQDQLDVVTNFLLNLAASAGSIGCGGEPARIREVALDLLVDAAAILAGPDWKPPSRDKVIVVEDDAPEGLQ